MLKTLCSVATSPLKRALRRTPPRLEPFTCVAFSHTTPPIRIGLLARNLDHAHETAHSLFPNHNVIITELPW